MNRYAWSIVGALVVGFFVGAYAADRAETGHRYRVVKISHKSYYRGWTISDYAILDTKTGALTPTSYYGDSVVEMPKPSPDPPSAITPGSFTYEEAFKGTTSIQPSPILKEVDDWMKGTSSQPTTDKADRS